MNHIVSEAGLVSVFRQIKHLLCWTRGKLLVVQLVEGSLCYVRKVAFLMVSLESFIDIILPAALWPWG
jgi:hypothetical protein